MLGEFYAVRRDNANRRIDHDAVERENYRESTTTRTRTTRKRKLGERRRRRRSLRRYLLRTKKRRSEKLLFFLSLFLLSSPRCEPVAPQALVLSYSSITITIIACTCDTSPASPKRRRLLLRRNYLLGAPQLKALEERECVCLCTNVYLCVCISCVCVRGP